MIIYFVKPFKGADRLAINRDVIPVAKIADFKFGLPCRNPDKIELVVELVGDLFPTLPAMILRIAVIMPGRGCLMAGLLVEPKQAPEQDRKIDHGY